MKSVVIDEEKNYALTRITKTKKGVIIKTSDHNTIITDINLDLNKSVKHNKIEFLNFKNLECQKKFQQTTSTGTYLSSSFDGRDDLNKMTNKFIKRLDNICHKTFKVVRMTKKKEKAMEDKYNEWNELRNKNNETSKEKSQKLESELAESYANEYFGKIEQETKGIDCTNGGFNSGSLWNLKKKMFAKSRDPPTAMLDKNGVLQTDEATLKFLQSSSIGSTGTTI